MALAQPETSEQVLNNSNHGSPAEAESRPGPKALAGPADPWTRAAQVAVIGLFVIALVWGAHVSQAVLVPVLLAWVIATMLLPVVRFMQEWKVPRVLSAVVLTAVLLAVVASVLVLLATPAAYWLGRATELGALLREKFQMLNQPLALLDEIRRTLSSITGSEPGAIKVEQPPVNVVTTTVAVLTPAVSQLVLFAGALLFYLIYQERIRATAVMLLHGHDARLEALRTLKCIDENMTTYFSTFTLVNACLGVVTFALTYLVGLPNPLLWGVLAGVLNYVPYLGPTVVAATLAVVGVLTFPTLAQAAVAPLIFVAIVTVEGQFLTPAIMGQRLEVNPFAVFLAIAFCTWLWGPIGAFLAVPLLMASIVSLEHAFAEAKPDLPD
jgi:predicted PurR-regulated permease PerM